MRLIFRTFVPFAGDYRVTNLLNHVERNFRFERTSGYKQPYYVTYFCLLYLRAELQNKSARPGDRQFFFSRPKPNVSRLWRPGAIRAQSCLLCGTTVVYFKLSSVSIAAEMDLRRPPGQSNACTEELANHFMAYSKHRRKILSSRNTNLTVNTE